MIYLRWLHFEIGPLAPAEKDTNVGKDSEKSTNQ